MKLASGNVGVCQSSPVRSTSDRVATSMREDISLEAPIPRDSVPAGTSQQVPLPEPETGISKCDGNNSDGIEGGVAGRSDLKNAVELPSGRETIQQPSVLDITGRNETHSGQRSSMCMGDNGGGFVVRKSTLMAPTSNVQSVSTPSDIIGSTREEIQIAATSDEQIAGLRNDISISADEDATVVSTLVEDNHPLLELDSPMEGPSVASTSTVQSVTFDLDAVSARLKALAAGSVPNDGSLNCDAEGLRFLAKINPSSNTEAEDELRREIR